MALSPGSLSFGGRRFLCSVFFRNIAEEESVPACSPAAKRTLRRAAPAQSYLDVETTISFKVSLFHTAQCLFFEKRGYFADWVSADLTLNLSQYSTPNIPPSPYDIRFGLPSDKVHAQISNAVEEVDSDWISYFAVPNAPVFAAWRNENLAGFLLLDDHADVPYCPFDARVGTIGCVGVLPAYRKQGIGLRMVDAATRELIARGCAWAHIGYTHLSHWYGRIGYQVCMEFWMGEKRLLN